MKILEKHHHWFWQIHMPIMTIIAFVLLTNPLPLLDAIISPWIWGVGCLAAALTSKPQRKNTILFGTLS